MTEEDFGTVDTPDFHELGHRGVVQVHRVEIHRPVVHDVTHARTPRSGNGRVAPQGGAFPPDVPSGPAVTANGGGIPQIATGAVGIYRQRLPGRAPCLRLDQVLALE